MMTTARIRWLLKKTHCTHTNQHEARFLSGLEAKLEHFGDDLTLSHKQIRKLEEIAAR